MYQPLENLFSFIAMSIDWSGEHDKAILLTRVHTLYSKNVSGVTVDMRQLQ